MLHKLASAAPFVLFEMPQNMVAVEALAINGISAPHTLLRFVIVWTELPFWNGQNLQLFLRKLVTVLLYKQWINFPWRKKFHPMNILIYFINLNIIEIFYKSEIYTPEPRAWLIRSLASNIIRQSNSSQSSRVASISTLNELVINRYFL